jgi:hypothetical protein
VLNLSRQQVVTLLTLVIVGVWIVTAVVRIWVPWPVANILDAAMPVVIGYYFVSKSANGKNMEVTT